MSSAPPLASAGSWVTEGRTYARSRHRTDTTDTNPCAGAHRYGGHYKFLDHIINEEVRSRIRQAIGNHDDHLTELNWYGHVTRSLGLAKTFLQGTVHGVTWRNRQRKRWEDNIYKQLRTEKDGGGWFTKLQWRHNSHKD
ncbi:hypothetical protein PoB_004762200 [Plakobranchus ocellatus]|uniref:Uncharacterized protein n=1 Tax=Plakobranchus ocellatus TaxID=259542 RepID=A0AAV4BP44_9GAST|nr:hypothetical protein PoB_004762200 [Plakobranchus ocellatus]